jgi:hypothetical protein
VSRSERQPRQRGVGTGVVAEPASREHARAAFSCSCSHSRFRSSHSGFRSRSRFRSRSHSRSHSQSRSRSRSSHSRFRSRARSCSRSRSLALALASLSLSLVLRAAAVSASCLFGMSLRCTPDKSAWVGRVGGGMGGFISAVQGLFTGKHRTSPHAERVKRCLRAGPPRGDKQVRLPVWSPGGK